MPPLAPHAPYNASTKTMAGLLVGACRILVCPEAREYPAPGGQGTHRADPTLS